VSSDTLDKLAQSDAPVTTAVHQRDVGKVEAEAQDWNSASLVGRTVTINRQRDELYSFWRDFNNLAHFLENIVSVEVKDERTAHWVVAAPAGQTVAWDSVITEDEDGRLIAWEAAPGAQIKHTGRVEFYDAAPGRGTCVRLTLAYEPPAGEIGKAIAKLFQKEPKTQARRDLRRFKQLMETGEISTARHPDAAPNG
jgi:uncharacterized membrane protein